MSTLPLFKKSKAPRVGEAEVSLMRTLLAGQGWKPAKWFPWDERTVRAVAAASKGSIISGQKGYALTDQASIAEVQHAADWLRHQSKAMAQRALEIERAMHHRQEIAS